MLIETICLVLSAKSIIILLIKRYQGSFATEALKENMSSCKFYDLFFVVEIVFEGISICVSIFAIVIIFLSGKSARDSTQSKDSKFEQEPLEPDSNDYQTIYDEPNEPFLHSDN